MTLDSDVAADFVLFDGGQTVTLTQRRATGETAVVVRNALNGTLSQRQVQALRGTSLDGDDMAWSLNVVEPGPAGVAVGDTLTDADNHAWNVISVERMTLDTRWILVTRKQQ